MSRLGRTVLLLQEHSVMSRLMNVLPPHALMADHVMILWMALHAYVSRDSLARGVK